MAKKRPIALLTSDTHLQDRAWHSRTTLEHDAFWAFDYMMEYAAKNEIAHVVAAGDLIDRQKNESDIVDFVRQQMQFCEENQIQFNYIQGQHEMQETPWLEAISPYANNLADDRDHYIGEFKVWGIDWTPLEEVQERLDEVTEDIDLLVMHQVCEEFMGGITTAELDWERVPHASTLLVGDYHEKHERLERKGKQGQKLSVLTCGSTAMQSVTEPPNKYFFVLYNDGSTESVQIPTRRFIRPPDLMSETDVETFIENVEGVCQASSRGSEEVGLWAELCKPIVYVRYQYDIPDAYKRIARAIGEWGHFFPKELKPKETPAQEEAREDRQQVIDGGLIGALPQVVSDEESDVFLVSKRLLESRNIAATLHDLRMEYLEDETEAIASD